MLVVVAFVIAQARNCLFSERSKYLKTVFVRQVHARNLRYSTIFFFARSKFYTNCQTFEVERSQFQRKTALERQIVKMTRMHLRTVPTN